jgi:hypothetical protein
MSCDTCKSECGREDGCGTRKGVQKDLLDGLIARLYPSRCWGEPDDEACFRAGLHRSEVIRLAQMLATALKAPAYVQAGGDDDLCSFIYVLCLGRQPSLLELRAGSGAEAGALVPTDTADSGLYPEADMIRERYLRIACSAVTRAACVQEVAMELYTNPQQCPDGMALIREIPLPGVFDPKLLKRFQKTTDLLMAHDVEHYDMGLLDIPAAEFGLLDGGYPARFGTAPALLNFFFYAQPVLTAAASFVPLMPAARAELAAPPAHYALAL